jgi:hypothetical protein
MAKEKKEDLEYEKTCGLIMPISEIDGCSEKHWEEVKEILEEVAVESGLNGRIVSETDSTNLIQYNIINRLYNDKTVICDVSGRNYNVMFELGLRIAFNKPVVVIFDKEGVYPFDITNIPYIDYPRNMNYHGIQKFKINLKKSLMDSLNEKENSYLKTYRDIKIFEAPDVELTEKDKLFLEEISNIKAVVEKIGEKYNNRIFLNRTREPLSDLSLREMYKKSLDIYTEFEKNYEIQFLLKEQLPIDIFVTKGMRFFKEKLPIYSHTELCEKLVDFYILKRKNFK